jgi:putative sigma-54 modulation protein
MNNDKLIISGHRLELTAAIKTIVEEKSERLFKHDDSIIRIRVELEHEPDGTSHGAFLARGQIESRGPIMTVSVKTEDLYKSIDLMVNKLDRKLRRRHRIFKAKRNQPREDVEQLPEAVSF